MSNLACAVPHRNCPYYQPTTGQCDYPPNTCVYQIEDDIETYITDTTPNQNLSKQFN